MNPGRLVARTAVILMPLAVVGFVVTMVLNAFVPDGYDAYGEVAIPGSASLWLPAGEVTATFHTRVIGSPGGSGLPLPEISLTIIPPDGVAVPQVTENIGITMTFNNDSRRRMASVQVVAEGSYTIRTDGQVGGYIAPRLAFGRRSSYRWLPWVFVGLFGCAVLTLIGSQWRPARSR